MDAALTPAAGPLRAGPKATRPQVRTRQPTTALTATVFFIAALSWSPLLPVVFKIPFTVGLLAAFCVFAMQIGSMRSISPSVTAVCAGMLLICVLFLLITQSTNLLLRTAPLPLLIFLAYQTRVIEGLPDRLCTWLTRFVAFGTAGAIAGLVYAYVGGPPLFEISNIDGRENGLYLSTFSNVYLLGIIRPSFIYDEAGALSFILCATVVLREVLGRSRGVSYFLMLGGLVTFSVTHMLLTIIFLQIANFFDIVSPRVVLFGDIDCHSRADGVCDEHGDISSSPVTPTYKGGIVALFVQLCVHIGLAVAFFVDKRYRFPTVVMTLLLLQRPYFEISGYGFVTFLMLFLMLAKPPRGSTS